MLPCVAVAVGAPCVARARSRLSAARSSPPLKRERAECSPSSNLITRAVLSARSTESPRTRTASLSPSQVYHCVAVRSFTWSDPSSSTPCLAAAAPQLLPPPPAFLHGNYLQPARCKNKKLPRRNTRVIKPGANTMDGAPVAKQGELEKLGGLSGSEWQTRSFALKSGRPPTLSFSPAASSAFGAAAPCSYDGGSIALSSSAAAAPTPGSSTDFTVANVEDARNALGRQALDLRAETELAREEWVAAAINSEIRRAASGRGVAAASALASSAVSYTFASLDQELLGITSPPADVINFGKWDYNGDSQDGFRQLTPEELRLLAAKLHSSPNVKVLNLSGHDMNASTIHDVAEALAKLTALQRVSLFATQIGAEGAGRLAEPLGKLTALQKLYLGSTV
jgi:hypothetical protein